VDLPDCLKLLIRRNAAEIRPGRDFHAHLDLLVRGLDRVLAEATATDDRPTQTKPAGEISAAETVTNSIGMRLVQIPAGEFLMGSLDSDHHADGWEKPQHPVRITKPFCLGVHAVTQREYEQVMGENPSRFKGDPRLPVESISWSDAIEFCNRLSDLEGLDQYYRRDGRKATIWGSDGYRLPTEAEWEYACRAGATTRWSCGNDRDILQRFAWFDVNSQYRTHPVGEKEPNVWGLFDMHGNVWEWCWDWFGESYYADSPTDDPHGPSKGTNRVFRGGCWRYSARFCRAARRGSFEPLSRSVYLGFRVAAVPPGE